MYSPNIGYDLRVNNVPSTKPLKISPHKSHTWCQTCEINRTKDMPTRSALTYLAGSRQLVAKV